MIEHFACPACTAPLTYSGTGATMQCPYCDSSVIVPPALRRRGLDERGRSFNITIGSLDGDDLVTIRSSSDDEAQHAAILGEVHRLTAAGQQAAALRLYREAFGVSAAEAQAAVAALTGAAHGAAQPACAPAFGRLRVATRARRTAAAAPPPARRTGCVAVAALLAFVLIAGSGVLTFVLSARVSSRQREIVSALVPALRTSGPNATVAAHTPAPADTPAAAATPTPLGFGGELLRFGSPGIGAGMFTDARAIAADTLGALYVADYDTGRVQVFSESGVYQGQWSFPAQVYVQQIAVTRARVLYASFHTTLNSFAANTGNPLAAREAEEETFGFAAWFDGGVAIAPDGGIVAVADGTIVRFAPDGAIALTIPNAVAQASGRPETTTLLAVDGLGNIYALAESQDVVYKFAADGKYLNRFGAAGLDGDSDGQGRLRAASSIAVDGKGRVYVGDIDGVEVFDSEGRSLALIDVPGYPLGLAVSADRLFVAARDKVIAYTLADQ